MYPLCRRDKASGQNTFDYGLDWTRMFTAIGIGPKLHCELITTECTPSLRENYSHLIGFWDTDTKAWLLKWQTWEFVENMSISILKGMLFKNVSCFGDRYIGGWHGYRGGTDNPRHALKAFCSYLEEVWKSFFNIIWLLKSIDKIASKGIFSKRAKRVVFYYFVSKELMDPKWFPSYPNVFWAWLDITRDEEGITRYGPFYMFLRDLRVGVPSLPMVSWMQKLGNYAGQFWKEYIHEDQHGGQSTYAFCWDKIGSGRWWKRCYYCNQVVRKVGFESSRQITAQTQESSDEERQEATNISKGSKLFHLLIFIFFNVCIILSASISFSLCL